MIDSIKLRIHNLKKYAVTVNFLWKQSGKGKTEFFSDLNKEDLQEYIKNKGSNHVFYHDGSTLLTLAYSDNLRLPSSHYQLAYMVSFKQDFIEFNFSLPKYKYGTNIFQLIKYSDQSAAATFEFMLSVLKNFLSHSLPEIIALNDIEIFEIDLCYNQFFSSKDEALSYLSAQRSLANTFARKTGAIPVNYNQEGNNLGIFYKTKRYSWKIYHKGTEFRKNDYPELLKNSHLIKFDLERMKLIADKILRYEVHFRSSFLTYMFRSMYFDCSRKTGEKTFYRKLWKMFNLENGKFQNKHFFLESVFDIRAIVVGVDDREFLDLQFYADQKNEVTFDQRLFNELYLFFWKFVKRFQLTSTGSSVTLLDLVKKYNIREHSFGKKGVNEKTFLKWLHWSQKESLKVAMRKGFMTESYYYQLLKKFKAMGLSDYNPLLTLSSARTDYMDYKYYFGWIHIN